MSANPDGFTTRLSLAIEVSRLNGVFVYSVSEVISFAVCPLESSRKTIQKELSPFKGDERNEVLTEWSGGGNKNALRRFLRFLS